MYYMPLQMYALILQQEILCTLYLTQDLYKVGWEAEGMWHNPNIKNNKIMKYHVLLWSFGKILPEDQDRDEFLYGYTIIRTSKKADL